MLELYQQPSHGSSTCWLQVWGLISIHNCMSQLLIINLSLCMSVSVCLCTYKHIFYWFCLSGELWGSLKICLYLHYKMECLNNFFSSWYLIDHQPRLDAWDKCSDLVHWEDPEGSGGEGGRRGGSGWGIHVYPRLIHVNVWKKPLQYCKVISLQLIKKNKLKNKVKKKKTFPQYTDDTSDDYCVAQSSPAHTFPTRYRVRFPPYILFLTYSTCTNVRLY